jgi:hypothetical protein
MFQILLFLSAFRFPLLACRHLLHQNVWARKKMISSNPSVDAGSWIDQPGRHHLVRIALRKLPARLIKYRKAGGNQCEMTLRFRL